MTLARIEGVGRDGGVIVALPGPPRPFLWSEELLTTADILMPDVVFPDQESSIWTLSEKTGEWYLHKFYKEQPDLNWDNPEVVAAMHDVVRFWLGRGVDGFRVDAVNVTDNPMARLRMSSISVAAILQRETGLEALPGRGLERRVLAQEAHTIAVDADVAIGGQARGKGAARGREGIDRTLTCPRPRARPAGRRRSTRTRDPCRARV